MNILCLTTRQFWPLDTGGKLRDYHLARELSRHARVTYVGFDDNDHPGPCPRELAAPFAAIERVPRETGYSVANILRGALGQLPLSVLNYTSPAMSHRIADLLRQGNFDSVQMESVHLVSYLPVVRAAGVRSVVADWHNIESELMARFAERASLPRRAYAKLTASKLRAAEDLQIAGSSAVIVTSDREAPLVAARNAATPVHVIENGVDINFFHPDAAQSAAVPFDDPAGHLVFVGSMDYHANIDGVIDFVQTTWPDIRAAFPELKFFIVGRNPPQSVMALSDRPGVFVTGSVDDVRPFFRRALASVVPLRVGGGTRLKILESLACGTPVISTSAGAEGLAAVPGVDLMLAESASDVVSAVARLRSDQRFAEQLGLNGRAFVERHHGWPSLGKRLYEIHEAIVRS